MTYSIIFDFFYYKDIQYIAYLQCNAYQPVYLVSYIVAMQLLSPVRFHETYKNTKQKMLLNYGLDDKLGISWSK